MSAPPSRRLITMGDIPDAPGWLERLLGPLNAFMSPVADALSRGLTFRENFAGEVREVDVTPPDEWVVPTMATGWAGTLAGSVPAPQPFTVRKDPNGDVQCRGRLDWIGGGVPPASSLITSLGGAYAPSFREVFDAFATNGAVYTPATVSINNAGELRWEPSAGGYRSLSLSGDVWWAAANPAPVRWATPIEVRLGTAAQPFPGKPGFVSVLRARRKDGKDVPTAVSAIPDWSPINLEKAKSAPGVRIHRVYGLTPAVQYTVTLLILPE